MNRRGFLVVVAGSVAGAPLRAPGQAVARKRRIGVLSPGPAAGEEFDDVVAALKALGWSLDANLAVEARSADADLARLRALADELVALPVDAIVAYGTEATSAAKRATATIPIVMASAGDPVGAGLVASLARPGGNVTGYSIVYPEIAPKRAALLHELLPGARRVGVFVNPLGERSQRQRAVAVMAYRSLGVDAFVLEIASHSEFLRALQEARRRGAEALDISVSVWTDAFTSALIAARLPAIVDGKDIVYGGALMSFAPDQSARNRRLAALIDKILRGARPADLPIEQPDRFELVINAKAARELDVRIPEALLVRADEVVR